jgi:hypothetical protein
MLLIQIKVNTIIFKSKVKTNHIFFYKYLDIIYANSILTYKYKLTYESI